MAAGTCQDPYWMGQAIALAALGAGTTRPNPLVGSVVVKDGVLVGQGYHRRAGGDHAEVAALRVAGSRARGATLYANLEPCIHHGRTPPCTDAILDAGVARVVTSLEDPNPAVSGRGVQALQAAGVEVRRGVLCNEAERINAPFLHLHRTGRPLVTVKAAASLDGRISALSGNSRWITGEPARLFAHRLRWTHDAVLVGAGTVRADDPQLTVRLPETETTVHGGPLPVVLSGSSRLSPEMRLFATKAGKLQAARVYVSRDRDSAGLAGADVVPVRTGPDGGLDLSAVLDDLGRSGVRSVLVEGGGSTIAGFLMGDLVDRYALFQAPVILGDEGGVPMAAMPACPAPDQGWWAGGQRELSLGRDRVVLAAAVRKKRCSQD